MRFNRIWRPANVAGQALVLFAFSAAVSGCGMQIPSIRSPFYLKSDNQAPIALTANRPAPSYLPPIERRSLNDDNTYVPPKVEFYCSGPNFDPNAECLPPRAASKRVALGLPASGRTIVVQRGDTLYSLAWKHGVSIDALADANALETHELSAGQELDLPQIALR